MNVITFIWSFCDQRFGGHINIINADPSPIRHVSDVWWCSEPTSWWGGGRLAEEPADLGERNLELLGDWAVDEEVGGEVDHDEEVGHALQAHDPQRRDVLLLQLDAGHLHVCQHKQLLCLSRRFIQAFLLYPPRLFSINDKSNREVWPGQDVLDHIWHLRCKIRIIEMSGLLSQFRPSLHICDHLKSKWIYKSGPSSFHKSPLYFNTTFQLLTILNWPFERVKAKGMESKKTIVLFSLDNLSFKSVLSKFELLYMLQLPQVTRDILTILRPAVLSYSDSNLEDNDIPIRSD